MMMLCDTTLRFLHGSSVVLVMVIWDAVEMIMSSMGS